jgi:hypothetical protein
MKIDDHQTDTSLNRMGEISTISIPESFQEKFRMIRVRQPGKNSSDYDTKGGITFAETGSSCSLTE